MHRPQRCLRGDGATTFSFSGIHRCAFFWGASGCGHACRAGRGDSFCAGAFCLRPEKEQLTFLHLHCGKEALECAVSPLQSTFSTCKSPPRVCCLPPAKWGSLSSVSNRCWMALFVKVRMFVV